MNPVRLLTPVLLATLLLTGCPVEPPVMALGGGPNYAEGALATYPGLAGVPNIDDDNNDGTPDWEERGSVEGDDERSLLYVQPATFEGLRKDEIVRLELGGQVSRVRVYHEGALILGEADGTLLSYDLEPSEDEQVFEVEYREYLAGATITLLHLDANGDRVSSDTAFMTAGPLILNHHLQPTQHVWVMDIPIWGGNAHMIDVFGEVLGDAFTGFEAAEYDYDVWIQDEVQMATLTADGQRIDVIIDSIRNRGLDPWAEDNFPGPEDEIVRTWGSGGATSLDSFGNLEISPPVDADGVEYPLGRIYYGDASWGHVTAELRNFLDDQKIQSPVVFDTGWLCVGHIDEYTSFVPDATAPRGFRWLMADTYAAWDVIGALDPSDPLARYVDHGLPTVGDFGHGVELLNEETQEDILDVELDKAREFFGLTEDEIFYMPSLFMDEPGCGQAALIPGMVNLIVANMDDASHIFMADPFFRDSVNPLYGQDEDPMIAAVEEMMPEELELHFVDNWEVYHLGLGEVHCGTNSTREAVRWWEEDVSHLLQGGE